MIRNYKLERDDINSNFDEKLLYINIDHICMNLSPHNVPFHEHHRWSSQGQNIVLSERNVFIAANFTVA